MLNFEGDTATVRQRPLVIVIASLAQAQKTNVDWDHNLTDFFSFKTYAWSKTVQPTPNPLMDQRIVAAIDAQLATKGLQK